MVQQLAHDLIINEDDRIVEGWVSVELKDNQKDIVPLNELYKALLKSMDRTLTINDTHTNLTVGKVLNFWFEEHPSLKKDDGSSARGIKAHYKIHKDYEIDHKVWEEIKTGKRTGLSIGGLSYKNEKVFDGEDVVSSRKNLYIPEISSVLKPANPYAVNDGVNLIAKESKEEIVTKNGDEMETKNETESLKKDESVVVVKTQDASKEAPKEDKIDTVITLMKALMEKLDSKVLTDAKSSSVQPEEKPKEPSMHVAKSGETIETPTPQSTQADSIEKGDVKPSVDLAYEIAKGKVVNFAEMEQQMIDERNEKIKQFLKR